MPEQTPRDWPALMSDETAGAYINVTGRTVRTLVAKGELPKPIKIPGTTCVRWVRAELDLAWQKWVEESKR